MDINLRCDACNSATPVSYDQLYAIWKQGYDEMPDDRREKIFLTAEIRCVCGNHKKFDGPMFQYTFGEVFYELLSLE